MRQNEELLQDRYVMMADCTTTLFYPDSQSGALWVIPGFRYCPNISYCLMSICDTG